MTIPPVSSTTPLERHNPTFLGNVSLSMIDRLLGAYEAGYTDGALNQDKRDVKQTQLKHAYNRGYVKATTKPYIPNSN